MIESWVLILTKKGLFRSILKIDRYRKFEDLRIFFEELNSNIKDMEEMRKKKEINLQHQRIVNFK